MLLLRPFVALMFLAVAATAAGAACTPATSPNTSGVTANAQLELLQEICNNQNASGTGIAAQASADSVSNLVAKSSGGKLFEFMVKIAATTGYVMVFDGTALPSNGAVTPCSATHVSGCQTICYPVLSNGTLGGAAFSFASPGLYAFGITLGFSSTGCDTLTASATAKFSGVKVQ